jgi:hypothetical protein
MKTGVVMRRLVILLLLTSASVSANTGEPTPPDQLQSVKSAEVAGLALYEAAKADTPTDAQAIAVARSKISDFCSFSYRAVLMKRDDSTVVYFIGQPSKPGDIVFGRHYRVGIEEVTPSTRSCFVQSPPANVAAAFITHLLSDAPSEFHVYESLVQPIPLMVGTRVGMWSVERGKIAFLGQMHGT